MNNSLCECISHYSQKVSLTPKTSNQCDPKCVCPMKIFQISGHRKKIIDLLGHRVYIQNFRQSWKISVEPWLSGLFLKFSWQKYKLPRAGWECLRTITSWEDLWGSCSHRDNHRGYIAQRWNFCITLY